MERQLRDRNRQNRLHRHLELQNRQPGPALPVTGLEGLEEEPFPTEQQDDDPVQDDPVESDEDGTLYVPEGDDER
jgi:hypothetical protein